MQPLYPRRRTVDWLCLGGAASCAQSSLPLGQMCHLNETKQGGCCCCCSSFAWGFALVASSAPLTHLGSTDGQPHHARLVWKRTGSRLGAWTGFEGLVESPDWTAKRIQPLAISLIHAPHSHNPPHPSTTHQSRGRAAPLALEDPAA